jgi:hypothetical protein
MVAEVEMLKVSLMLDARWLIKQGMELMLRELLDGWLKGAADGERGEA